MSDEMIKMLRKSQDQCQRVILERDELRKRLRLAEENSRDILIEQREWREYAEERQQLLSQLGMQRRELKIAQEKIAGLLEAKNGAAENSGKL